MKRCRCGWRDACTNGRSKLVPQGRCSYWPRRFHLRLHWQDCKQAYGYGCSSRPNSHQDRGILERHWLQPLLNSLAEEDLLRPQVIRHLRQWPRIHRQHYVHREQHRHAGGSTSHVGYRPRHELRYRSPRWRRWMVLPSHRSDVMSKRSRCCFHEQLRLQLLLWLQLQLQLQLQPFLVGMLTKQAWLK